MPSLFPVEMEVEEDLVQIQCETEAAQKKLQDDVAARIVVVKVHSENGRNVRNRRTRRRKTGRPRKRVTRKPRRRLRKSRAEAQHMDDEVSAPEYLESRTALSYRCLLGMCTG